MVKMISGELLLKIIEKQSFIDYRKYDDKILINMTREGDHLAEQQIIKRYKKLVKMRARSYFLIGADIEDVIQEGMIGLYKAIRNYDSFKMASFKRFAEICVNRQIITAVKKASRKKHKPLNFSISLSQPLSLDKSDGTLLDIINDVNINDPMCLLLTWERNEELKNKLKKILSKLEIKVLNLYLEEKTYQEIDFDIKKSTKSIDNAIQRIKTKIEICE